MVSDDVSRADSYSNHVLFSQQNETKVFNISHGFECSYKGKFDVRAFWEQQEVNLPAYSRREYCKCCPENCINEFPSMSNVS